MVGQEVQMREMKNKYKNSLENPKWNSRLVELRTQCWIILTL